MIYRKADRNDVANIAQLHAESWRNAYRGILSDAYLDNAVFDERLSVWQNRFDSPRDNQYVLLAIKDHELAGFVCVYGDYYEDEADAKWGSLIDNLHVRKDLKGQGIGQVLMQHAFDWARENYPQKGVYLWVYEVNMAAKGFYEAMGGKSVERILHHNEDDTEGYALRYVWLPNG